MYVEKGVLVGRFALQPLYGSIPIYDVCIMKLCRIRKTSSCTLSGVTRRLHRN